jgi:hypothetical protein
LLITNQIDVGWVPLLRDKKHWCMQQDALYVVVSIESEHDQFMDVDI